MADKNGLSKEQAQKIAAACKRHQIRIIPLVNLLVTNRGIQLRQTTSRVSRV